MAERRLLTAGDRYLLLIVLNSLSAPLGFVGNQKLSQYANQCKFNRHVFDSKWGQFAPARPPGRQVGRRDSHGAIDEALCVWSGRRNRSNLRKESTSRHFSTVSASARSVPLQGRESLTDDQSRYGHLGLLSRT